MEQVKIRKNDLQALIDGQAVEYRNERCQQAFKLLTGKE